MAKAKTRKRGSARGGAARMRFSAPTRPTEASLVTTSATERQPANSATTHVLKRPTSRFGSLGSSGIVTTSMVALGCWGMTIFFFFLYPDPNHILFGCFAALMALMWSYSFAQRLRKWQQRRV